MFVLFNTCLADMFVLFSRYTLLTCLYYFQYMPYWHVCTILRHTLLICLYYFKTCLTDMVVLFLNMYNWYVCTIFKMLYWHESLTDMFVLFSIHALLERRTLGRLLKFSTLSLNLVWVSSKRKKVSVIFRELVTFITFKVTHITFKVTWIIYWHVCIIFNTCLTNMFVLF